MRSNRGTDDPEATQIVIKRRLEAVDEEQAAAAATEKPQSDSQPEPVLPAGRRRKVVIYSAGLAFASTVALTLLISYAWYLQPDQSLTGLSEQLQRYALINTLMTMLVAGAAGGALANLREFLLLGRRQNGVPVRLEVPLYLRPLSSAVMGVLIFFLLQFFVAVLSVGGTTQGWALLHGRLAYVAVALVVGFGVRDLERARDVAATLIARRR